MKLKPLGDRLIVRAIEEEETTASGLVPVSYTHLDVYKRQLLYFSSL